VRCSTFLEAFAYAKVERLSPALYGILLQRLITVKHKGWHRLKPRAVEGDLVTSNHMNLEVKVSFGKTKLAGKRGNIMFEFRGIRVNCISNFYILIAYNVTKDNYTSLGELFVFKMTKGEILSLMGTKKSKSEFAVVVNSVRWKAMLEYRISLTTLSTL